jgi:pimeloyl-ACP methyl ester carboxylesterase
MVAEMGGAHRVLALDPFVVGDLSVAGQAGKVAAAMAAADLGRAVVVGHSLGGLIALELGAHPDLVSAVVALDASLDSRFGERAGVGVALALRRVLGPQALGPRALRDYFERLFGEQDSPAFRDELLTRASAVPPRAVGDLIAATVRYPGRKAMARLRAPALYVRGSVGGRVRGLPSGVSVVDVPEVGHWIHVQEPTAVATAVNRFLSGLVATA